MKTVILRLLVLLVSGGLLLSSTSIIAMSWVGQDSHALSFATEHGVDHLIIFHATDFSTHDDSLIISDGKSGVKLEFHLAMLAGLTKEKPALSIFVSNNLLERYRVTFLCSNVITCARFESDVGPLKKSNPSLRI